jgi:phage tail sheath protein FI
MAIQLSPGVAVSEVDLTTVVPSVSTSTGAFAGNFTWGPANVITIVDSETTLVGKFGGPNSNTYLDFFTCTNFLSYANDLRVVRAIDANATNADANTSGPNTLVSNEDIFNIEYLHTGAGNNYGAFMARYAGALGNSIQVDVYDANVASTYANTNTTTFTTGGTTYAWSSVISSVPGTSTYVSNAGGSNDEFHVVVSDAGGLITGVKGTILEVFSHISKAYDAIDGNGVSTFYKNVILNTSRYVYAVDPVDYANTNSTWGLVSTTTFAQTHVAHTSLPFNGGVDASVSDGDLISAYQLFANKDAVDVSLFLTGAHDVTVVQNIIDNITTPAGSTTGRGGDSLVFISPPYAAVVNQAGNETQNITTWLNTSLERSTSYAVVDSGWKYMYDKYNNVYRYVPLNADVAGLCAFTDEVRDPWYSPAGFNRGNIKNAIKLAWNPAQTDRDILYPQGVNPVVTFPGNGTILYGDKTLQGKPSAFDRINVRRLFIVLEKSIARAAKYSLFEFNDSFTQAQFIALVAPFLRQVQGRRGITDFRVVCDSTNNTAQVIDSNQFIGDIYIKPARSINFIQLNFVAVGTGVNFSEVAGATS